VLRPGAGRWQLVRHDSKGSTEEALAPCAPRSTTAQSCPGQQFPAAAVLATRWTSTTLAMPQRRALFLNYSAVDPALTNQRCSLALPLRRDADMRLAALDVLQCRPRSSAWSI
jgi:branched-chain amino acid transport system substrate-binding protein